MRTLNRSPVGIALIAGFVVLVAGAANAVAGPKIAVKPFTAKGVDQSVAGIVETSFCSALAAEGMSVLCPDELSAIVAQQQMMGAITECGEGDDCSAAIAKATKSDRIISGEVSKLGKLFIVSVTMINGADNKVLKRATEKVSKVEDLLDKVGPLAKKLVK